MTSHIAFDQNAIGSVRATRVEMTYLIQPIHANILGNAFGGQIVSWIDMCAAISAHRHARMAVVTASMDAVQFLLPIRIGHVIVIQSQVNAVFNSSMECGVTVWSEEPTTALRHKAMKAYATFVALNSLGRPQNLPRLILENEEDKRRAASALIRRQQRLELRKQLEATMPT